jgi:hypothetical protein
VRFREKCTTKTLPCVFCPLACAGCTAKVKRPLIKGD